MPASAEKVDKEGSSNRTLIVVSIISRAFCFKVMEVLLIQANSIDELLEKISNDRTEDQGFVARRLMIDHDTVNYYWPDEAERESSHMKNPEIWSSLLDGHAVLINYNHGPRVNLIPYIQ